MGALVALVGLGSLAANHHSQSAPRGSASDLVVLWFNLQNENQVTPEALAEALAQSGADVIALAEARPIRPVLAALDALYPHRIGCQDGPACNLLILSNVPIDLIELRALQSGPERLAKFVLKIPGREAVTVVAAHMIKPWYQSMSHKDRWALHRPLRLPSNPGPVLVVGDFNAAPWSRRMQTLARWYELTHPPWPLATWPAAMGPAGVPIDHILMRGGLGLTQVTPWGKGLGSNHRGLMAEIEIPLAAAHSDGPELP